MKLIAAFVGVFIVVVGLMVLLRGYYIRDVGAAAVVLATTTPIITIPSAPSAPEVTNGPMTLHGTAIMDTSSGLPAVPYIKYINEKGGVATKQLIFINERGCYPGAGDIPCVPNYPGSSAYPKFSTGQTIVVDGYMHENRFLVTKISVES